MISEKERKEAIEACDKILRDAINEEIINRIKKNNASVSPLPSKQMKE